MGARAARVLQARARDPGVRRVQPRPPRRGRRLPPRLSGLIRTVLVTGASSGIGAACAARLAGAGWRVLAGIRSGEAPAGTEAVQLDVTREEDVHALQEIEPLDALVNNAGIAVAAPLEFLPPDELRAQLEVNVVGQLAVTQAVLPVLRAARGRIVFIGSVSGRSALPFIGPYAASKHALEAVADSLRVELAPWGIGVTIVEPGTIRTPMWARGGTRAQELAEHAGEPAAELYGERAAAFRRTAMERSANGAPPEAVAAVVERALTAKRPPPRVLVGRDAHIRAAIERFPDRLRDRAFRKLLLRE
ncbi:MAG TPA: SDR family oxidoreductase [Gaiellaceae bacterium]|nr:SDR family oxidoreductase [Gaiellaceae bacterium]